MGAQQRWLDGYQVSPSSVSQKMRISCLYSGLDAGIKIRPNAAEVIAMGPEFSRRWEEYYASAPDKPVLIIAPMSLYVSFCSVFPLADEM